MSISKEVEVQWLVPLGTISTLDEGGRSEIFDLKDKILKLCSCSSEPSMLLTPSPDLMNPPCKASDAGEDSDEDLQADTETAQCLHQLRLDKYRWQAYYRAIGQ